MKTERITAAYDKAMQALALVQIAGVFTREESGANFDLWRVHEVFKTLHDIIGESSGILAEELDNAAEKKAKRGGKA